MKKSLDQAPNPSRGVDVDDIEVKQEASAGRSGPKRQQRKSTRYKWNVSILSLGGKLSSYIAFVSSHNMNLFKRHYRFESVAAAAADIAKSITQGHTCRERLNFPGAADDVVPVDIRSSVLSIRHELISQGEPSDVAISKAKQVVVKILKDVAESICDYTSNHRVPQSISTEMLDRVVTTQAYIDDILSNDAQFNIPAVSDSLPSPNPSLPPQLDPPGPSGEPSQPAIKTPGGIQEDGATPPPKAEQQRQQDQPKNIRKGAALPGGKKKETPTAKRVAFKDEDEVFDQIRAGPGVNLSRNDVAVPHGVFCPPATSLPCVEQVISPSGVSSTPPPPCRDPRIRVAPEATGSTAETPRDSNKHKQSGVGLKRYRSKTLAQCLAGNEELGAKECVQSTGSQAIACSHDTLCFVYLRQEALYRIMNLEKIIKSFGWDLKLAGLDILSGAVVVVSRTDGWKMRRISSWCPDTMNVNLEDDTSVSPFELANEVLEPGKRSSDFVVQEYNSKIHNREVEPFTAEKLLGVFFRLLCCARAVRKLPATQDAPRLIKNLVQKLITGPPQTFLDDFSKFLDPQDRNVEENDARIHASTLKTCGGQMGNHFRHWLGRDGEFKESSEDLNVEQDLKAYLQRLREVRGMSPPESPELLEIHARAAKRRRRGTSSPRIIKARAGVVENGRPADIATLPGCGVGAHTGGRMQDGAASVDKRGEIAGPSVLPTDAPRSDMPRLESRKRMASDECAAVEGAKPQAKARKMVHPGEGRLARGEVRREGGSMECGRMIGASTGRVDWRGEGVSNEGSRGGRNLGHHDVGASNGGKVAYDSLEKVTSALEEVMEALG
ncbi:hypothetical protein BSKO_09384 [Bryopsis sp. KO-2023]|nr:hypothetical protein BSKO_09384 [Bryopsis sp. KO-2023]